MKRSEKRQKAVQASAAKKQTTKRGRMVYHSVRSSTVCAIGYDDDARCLGIMFGKGGVSDLVVYHYQDVPRSVFDALMDESHAGRSMGAAVAAWVKGAGYAFRRLERSEWAGIEHGPFHHVTQEEKDTCPICNKQKIADVDFAKVETRAVAWIQYNEIRVREMLITAAKFGWRSAHCFDDWDATKSKLLGYLGPRKFSEPHDVAGSVTGRMTVREEVPHQSVENAVRDAVLLERERCARVADEELRRATSTLRQGSSEGVISEITMDFTNVDVSALQRVAAAIRLGDPEKEMEP